MKRFHAALSFLLALPLWGAVTPQGLVEGYHEIGIKLSLGDIKGARDTAKELIPDLVQWQERKGKQNPGESARVDRMNERLKALGDEKSDPTTVTRTYAMVSQIATGFITQSDKLKDRWQLYYCAAASEKGFGYWSQPRGEPMANPYAEGKPKLAGCGVKKQWSDLP